MRPLGSAKKNIKFVIPISSIEMMRAKVQKGDLMDLLFFHGLTILVLAAYSSCCVVVKDMQRCVYAIPTVSFMLDNKIIELEKKVEESRMSLMAAKDQFAKQGRDIEKSRVSSTDIKDTIDKLEKDVEVSQTALQSRLHELALDFKTEMAKRVTGVTLPSGKS
ncbi:hypothetical protein OROHE_023566 [Orobanche hederae]